MKLRIRNHKLRRLLKAKAPAKEQHKQTKRIETFLLIKFKITKPLLEYSTLDERV